MKTDLTEKSGDIARPATLALVILDEMANRLSGRVSGRKRSTKSTSSQTGVVIHLRRSLTSGEIQVVSDSLGTVGRMRYCRDGLLVRLPADLSVSVRACYFARSVLEVLMDSLGEDKLNGCSLSSIFSLFRRSMSWPECDFEKNAKYWFVRIFAQYLHNDGPLAPPASYGPREGRDWLLFSGALRQVLANRLMTQSLKCYRLFNGLTQGAKRGCFQISPLLVRKTLEGHAAALGAESRIPWAAWSSGEREADLLTYIGRVVHDLYRPNLKPKLYEASTSASLGRTRKEGGAYDEVFAWIHSTPSGLVHLEPEMLHSMVETRPGVVETNFARELPSFSEALKRFHREFRLEPLQSCLPPHMDVPSFAGPGFLQDWWDLSVEPEDPPLGFESDDTEEPLQAPKPREESRGAVRVQSVLEPLKARLVSAGEAIKYWLARSFQKYMWGGLQRTPVFRLTGRPLMDSDLLDLIGSEGAEDGFWVSGDYSAATDSVKMQWTMEVFEALLSRAECPVDYCRVLRRVIYGQELLYPQGNEDLNRRQMSGQLMGSPLSFPILCIVNLCTFWAAYEKTVGHKVSLRHLPVLINGDDILFHVNGENSPLYREWKAYASAIGFKLSPGKNFTHREFLQINSTSYVYRKGVLTRVPFLNVGLLIGQSKVARVSAPNLTIQGCYGQCVPESVNPVRSHRRFLHYHVDEILSMSDSGRFSLTIDPLLGGLGFPCPEEVREDQYDTTFQKQFARFCWARLKDRIIGPKDAILKAYHGCVQPMKSHLRTKHSPSWGSYELQDRLCPLRDGESVVEPMDLTGSPLQRILLGEDEEEPAVPTLVRPRTKDIREFIKQRRDGSLKDGLPKWARTLSRLVWWVRRSIRTCPETEEARTSLALCQ